MRLSRAALLLGAALLPFSATAQPLPTATAIKPLPFTERTLPNGLRVYAIRDTTTPNVAIQVWYDVGSKDDPAGRSGFAHMFEHLMFKATRNLAPEQMDRLTEDVGGNNNASTGDDATEYHEVVPANHLQRLLFAEADRMSALVVEPVTFVSERDVVKEELRQNTLARPYGKLFSLYYPAAAYTTHPYARGTIGSIANLDSSSVDDVRAFHAVYYRPDNAILVVSGNFDEKQLNAWVDQYFGPITKPNSAIPRVTVTEPPRTVAKSYTVYEPNTPLPAVLIAWPVPADRDTDTPALMVLQAILATGESSRLYQSLVYRDQLAQSAEASLDTKQGPGNLIAYAILAGGKTAVEGEAALRREVARFRDTPVTAAELAEARNEIQTTMLKAGETAEGKARILANSVIIDGDPRATEKQIDAVGTVTAADVQRVARKYLGDSASVAIRYLPQEAGKTGDTIAVQPSVQVHPLTPPANVAVFTQASAAQRIAPPAPGAPVVAAIPKPVETRLANGLRVITIEKHGLPLVTASLSAIGGGATDLAGRAGTASLSADLMTKGTATRSASEIAAQVESLGASIDSDAGRDSALVGLTVKADQLDKAMTILADVALHPAFAPAEIERARAQAIDAVGVTVKNPTQLAGLVAARAALGGTPYGAALEGTPASLKAITRADITATYARSWRPDQAALVLAGDITPAQAKAIAERYFAGWKANGAATPALSAPTAYPAPRVMVIDMPGAAQAGVVVARPGIARADPVYYPLSVANTVLGGGYSSRLNQEIRIKRGLSYGAGSGVSARRLPGTNYAQTSTKNETAPQVVQIITAEMARIGQLPAPTNEELESRKAVLVGGFGRSVETTEGIAGVVQEYAVEGVPLGELQHYSASVEAVDAVAVQTAAARYLDPKAASIVVVGDAKTFVPELRKTYPALEVIPETALKLDSPVLK